MPHLSSNNMPHTKPEEMVDPSWSDAPPLLNDHKRLTESEVSRSDTTISRILLIAVSAQQTSWWVVVTGGLYCTDYLPIIFNLPSSYLAP